MYVYVYIYTYLRTCIYIYVHTHTHTSTHNHTTNTMRLHDCVYGTYCYTQLHTRMHTHLMPATQVASSSIENRKLPPVALHTLVSLRGYTPSTGIAALSSVCDPCMFVTEMQGEQAP